jgi:hypothetical protein
MLDLECSLVETFGCWLSQIDETDIESLIPFIRRFPEKHKTGSKPRKRKMAADQVNWL